MSDQVKLSQEVEKEIEEAAHRIDQGFEPDGYLRAQRLAGRAEMHQAIYRDKIASLRVEVENWKVHSSGLYDLTVKLRAQVETLTRDRDLWKQASDGLDITITERDSFSAQVETLTAQLKGVGIVPYLDRMKELGDQVEKLTRERDNEHEAATFWQSKCEKVERERDYACTWIEKLERMFMR